MKVAEYLKKNDEALPPELAELLAQETSIWTNDACYGCCIQAMEKAGFERKVIEKVRSCLRDAFDELTVEEAEKKWWCWCFVRGIGVRRGYHRTPGGEVGGYVMEKLDKVIAGLECCNDAKNTPDACLMMCPYWGETDGDGVCIDILDRDALDLLREYRERLNENRYHLGDSSQGDLIRLSDLMKFPIRIDHYDKVNGNEHFVYGVETVLEYAENMPRVEAEPVVHAHWVKTDRGMRCSNPACRCLSSLWDDNLESRFCPWCGAHMDEEVAK